MKLEKYIPTSLIDYPGHIATVVFTIGCNWNCWYCQNRALLHKNSSALSEPEFFSFLQSRKTWLDGVVVCGGEPTLQPDIVSFISNIKDMGYHIKLDTNGSRPEVIQKLIDLHLIDYIAMDIKAPISKYPKICGVNVDTPKIAESIQLIKNSGIDYEFRTTVSPDLDIQDITNIAQYIKGAKVYYLQQYNPPDNSCPPAHNIDYLQRMLQECEKYTHTILR